MKSIPRDVSRAVCLIVSLTLAAIAADGQPPQVDARPPSTWTVDDVLSAEYAGSYKISPDCRWAVWIKSTPDKAKGETVGNLFLSSLTSHQEIQLTRGSDGCSSPKWSPDGQLIAFLSSRPNPKAKVDDKNKTQIWLTNPFGGEPWALTSGDRAVYIFDWAGSNDIIYSAQEEPSASEQNNKDKKDFSQVIEDDEHDPPVRLFKVNVKSAKTARLTENTDHIQNFWASTDGTRVVTSHARSLRNSYDMLLKPVIFLTDLKTGKRKQIFTDAKYNLLWPVSWQRDGQGFYAANASTSNPKYPFPAFAELYHYSLATDRIEKVDLDWDRGLFSADLAVADQGFIALLADGVRPRSARYSLAGGRWRREWVTGIHATNVNNFQLGHDDKTFLYCHSTVSLPSQWYRATLAGTKIESPEQITSLNSQFEKKPKASFEIVHWKGALGDMVEGVLLYPLAYQSGKKYPLVVEIHGGPDSIFDDEWSNYPLWNNNFLNARGTFVFRPNYHGSTGYGLKWAESITGRLTELEVEDINKGIDYLVDRGLVDHEKLAVTGWSYGGTLTAAITTVTNRFKAAIAGDGPIDFIDYWGKSDIGGWFCGSCFGKSPLDDPAMYMRYSPFYQMGKVTTPTLILFGSEENRVPVDQGWMYYRALQQNGKTDVRFVLFPGEKHGPSKLVYLKRSLEEELAWLDKYLFKNAVENEKDPGK
jgi:dipeptidyl aminopeptidase/acylaminoacyl peptidase